MNAMHYGLLAVLVLLGFYLASRYGMFKEEMSTGMECMRDLCICGRQKRYSMAKYEQYYNKCLKKGGIDSCVKNNAPSSPNALKTGGFCHCNKELNFNFDGFYYCNTSKFE